MITREMWYEWIAKAQGREPKKPGYYTLNEVEEKTTYELQYGKKGEIFLGNKKGKNVLIGDPNNKFVLLTFDEFKKVVNFAKKNGFV